jgi:hypothetical protein
MSTIIIINKKYFDSKLVKYQTILNDNKIRAYDEDGKKYHFLSLNKSLIIINMKNYVIVNKKNGDKILIKSK